MKKEISSADRCRKNNWYSGCVLKAKSNIQESLDEYWKVTAIGEEKVLGKRINLTLNTTSGEEIMDFDDSEFSWRIHGKNLL